MAINFTRLFTTAGLLCGALNELNTFRGTTLPARQTSVAGQLGTVAIYGPYVSGWYQTIQSAKDANAGYPGQLGSLVKTAIIEEVNSDRPLSSKALDVALQELVRQMGVSSQTLAECPSTVTVAAVGSPTGDHQFVFARYEGLTGRISDFMIPDVYLIEETADRSQGGTAFAETFSLVGKTADKLPTDATYPSGTSINTSVSAIDPATDGGLVTDPGFPNWTVANTPDAPWAIYAGVAGTSIFKATDDPRSTSHSLRFFGAGAIVLKVRQLITAEALTAYTAQFRVKKVADPSTDWCISMSLTDNTGTAVTGANSYSNVITSATCASLSADWLNVVTGEFCTPAVLPAGGLYLELRMAQFGSLSTAPVANSDAYVSHVAMHKATPLYAGGPGVNCYSGVTQGVVGDTRTATVALTTGVPSTYLIRGIDRLLGGALAAAAVRIPTVVSSTPATQPDSLVT